MKWIAAVLIAIVITTPASAEPAGAGAAAQRRSLRESVERLRFDDSSRGWSYAPASRASRKNGTAQKATAAFAIGFLGMIGGAFAGGWLDAMLGRDCHSEDPGFKGALIGMPVGAAAGGIVGWRLAR